MRSAGSQPRLETSVKYEPGYDCVGESPQARSEPRRRWVQSSVTVEFSRELESSTDDMGKRQIHLLVVIKTGSGRAADQELAEVEIEMKSRNVLACEKGKRVIHAPTAQAICSAG